MMAECTHLTGNEGIDEVDWGLREGQEEAASPGGVHNFLYQPCNLLVQLRITQE